MEKLHQLSAVDPLAPAENRERLRDPNPTWEAAEEEINGEQRRLAAALTGEYTII